MKSASSKLLLPAILIFISLILFYINNEDKGLEFIFDNIFLIFIFIMSVAFVIFVKIREKTGQLSEYQTKKMTEYNNLFTKNDKKRQILSVICIVIASIISAIFNWYYSIPLIILAVIIFFPVIKKNFVFMINYDKDK